jgi:hypothetical protein
MQYASVRPCISYSSSVRYIYFARSVFSTLLLQNYLLASLIHSFVSMVFSLLPSSATLNYVHELMGFTQSFVPVLFNVTKYSVIPSSATENLYSVSKRDKMIVISLWAKA